MSNTDRNQTARGVIAIIAVAGILAGCGGGSEHSDEDPLCAAAVRRSFASWVRSGPTAAEREISPGAQADVDRYC